MKFLLLFFGWSCFVLFWFFVCVFFFPLAVSLVSKLLLFSLISACVPFLPIGGKGLVETKEEN